MWNQTQGGVEFRADIKRRGPWFFPGYFHAKIDEKKEPKEIPGSFDSLHYTLVIPGDLKS